MIIRLYYDRQTDRPHIENHHIQDDEVADVLLKPGEDRIILNNPQNIAFSENHFCLFISS